ncbi:MAG: hypothetical protein H6773_01750 [Pseudomonadales bacterium]|nr:hypothetical protein [Pseudomonadales bacterium]
MKLSLLYEILAHSVTSIKRYNHLLLLKNKTIVLYFFFWMGLMSIAQGIHAGVFFVPKFFSELTGQIDTLVANYPDDLFFKWDGNSIITSSYETLEVPYPDGFDPTEYYLPAHFFYFTSSEVENPQEEFGTYFMVATPTQFHMQEENTTWSTTPYSEMLTDMPSTTLTVEGVRALGELWHETAGSLQKYAQVAVGMLVSAGTLFNTIVVLLIRTILIFMVVKFLVRIKTTYKKTLKLAALFTVPATIVQTLVIYLYGSDFYGVSGLTFWILFVLYIWFGKVTIKHIKTKRN